MGSGYTAPEYRKFPGRLPKYKPPTKLLINKQLDSDDSYFLHVRSDGTEVRLKQEPKELANRTHLVTIINVEADGTLVEEVRVKYPAPSEPQGSPSPYGSGWEYHSYGLSERTQNWRRRRQP